MPKRIIENSEEVMGRALDDYQNRLDLTTEEIAVKHGVSTATLTVWARKNDVPYRNRGRKPQDEPTARQLAILRLATVYHYVQVGRRFGMKKQSIYRIVKRWEGWVKKQPFSAPFDPGDVLLWRGKKLTVTAANNREGMLVDSKGKEYKNFQWNGGRIPQKIGVNPRYVHDPQRKKAAAAQN